MQIVHTVGLPVFTTVYLPAWMRLLGARLGRHTEMSTVWRINPDMLTAGDGVFFADGCMIGGAENPSRPLRSRSQRDRRSHASSATARCCRPERTSATAACSASCRRRRMPTQSIPDNTDWLGSPGFLLPNRQKVSGFDRQADLQADDVALPAACHDRRVAGSAAGLCRGRHRHRSLLVILAVYAEYGVWGAYTAIPLLTWAAHPARALRRSSG